jgi:hypothetical protein
MMPKRGSPAPTRDSISCGICAFVPSGDGYGIALCRDRPREVHPPGCSWMVAMLERNSRNTGHCNPVA